ncbi:MAG TPA: hypothetical protein PL105_06105, partial [Caldilineaceae bacterium]|nr:hypothetical protein [Caldilineaceae bacterium]
KRNDTIFPCPENSHSYVGLLVRLACSATGRTNSPTYIFVAIGVSRTLTTLKKRLGAAVF